MCGGLKFSLFRLVFALIPSVFVIFTARLMGLYKGNMRKLDNSGRTRCMFCEMLRFMPCDGEFPLSGASRLLLISSY
jgi:hypothetical protein